jgi:hypothetical protein
MPNALLKPMGLAWVAIRKEHCGLTPYGPRRPLGSVAGP